MKEKTISKKLQIRLTIHVIKDSEKFLSAFFEVTTETLKKKEEIALVGFGSFSVVERKARMGMDFKTKKSVAIPASNGIKFKAGKNLKDAVN